MMEKNQGLTFEVLKENGSIKLYGDEDNYFVINIDGTCKYFFTVWEHFHPEKVLSLLCVQFGFEFDSWEKHCSYELPIVEDSGLTIRTFNITQYEFMLKFIGFLVKEYDLQECYMTPIKLELIGSELYHFGLYKGMAIRVGTFFKKRPFLKESGCRDVLLPTKKLEFCDTCKKERLIEVDIYDIEQPDFTFTKSESELNIHRKLEKITTTYTTKDYSLYGLTDIVSSCGGCGDKIVINYSPNFGRTPHGTFHCPCHYPQSDRNHPEFYTSDIDIEVCWEEIEKILLNETLIPRRGPKEYLRWSEFKGSKEYYYSDFLKKDFYPTYRFHAILLEGNKNQL
jgi:hypothetical protein